MKLYQLTEQYRSLEALEASEDLPAEVIRDTLEGLTGQLQEKATNVALFIRNMEVTAEAVEAAASKMKERADRLRTRAQSLTDYLLFNMQASGITKIESPFFTLAVRNNPATVVIDDPTLIPDAYKRTPPPPPPPVPAPDKRAIGAAIKAGEVVPGAHTESAQRLEIKL